MTSRDRCGTQEKSIDTPDELGSVGGATAGGAGGWRRLATWHDLCVPEPIFFASPAALRTWFAQHAASETELEVGYHKKSSGLATLTWSEAVDEALCVGWIDGVRHSIDETSHRQRFTPRKKSSMWSTINIAKYEALLTQGRMQPAGTAAFEQRTTARSGVYSFEQPDIALDAESQARLKADVKSWEFWERQPASYRKAATWWVIGAKRLETKQRRLEQLIADCAAGARLKHLTRNTS